MTAATVENQEFYINFHQRYNVLEVDERMNMAHLYKLIVRNFHGTAFDRIVIQKEPPYPGMKPDNPERELHDLFFFVRCPSSPSQIIWHQDGSLEVSSPPQWTFGQFLEEAKNIRSIDLDDVHFCYNAGRLCLTSRPIR